MFIIGLIITAIILCILVFLVALFAKIFLKMPRIFDFKGRKKTGIFSKEWMDWLEKNNHSATYNYVIPRKTRQARYARSHEVHFNAIIKEHYYDTDIAEHFFVQYTLFLQAEPCAKHYYKANDGTFFCITARLGKKDAFSNIPEKEMKRILTDEPALYMKYIAGADKNPDLQAYMKKEEDRKKAEAAKAQAEEQAKAAAEENAEPSKKKNAKNEKNEEKKKKNELLNRFGDLCKKAQDAVEVKITEHREKTAETVEATQENEKNDTSENLPVENKEEKENREVIAEASDHVSSRTANQEKVPVETEVKQEQEQEQEAKAEIVAEETNKETDNTEDPNAQEAQRQKDTSKKENLEEVQSFDDDFDEDDDLGAVHADTKVDQSFEMQSEEKARKKREEKAAREIKKKEKEERTKAYEAAKAKVAAEAAAKNIETEKSEQAVDVEKAKTDDAARGNSNGTSAPIKPKRERRKMTMTSSAEATGNASIGFGTNLDKEEILKAAEENMPADMNISVDEDELLDEIKKEAEKGNLGGLDAVAEMMPHSGK